MTSSLKTRLLLAPALFCAAPLLLAQAPTGTMGFSFGRDTYPIWDFSGPYTFSQEVGGVGGSSMPLTFGVSLQQDLSGHLHGSGSTMVTLGSDTVAVNFTATGTVSQGGNATKVTLTVHLSNVGLAPIADQYRSFSANLSYNLRVDPNINDAPAWIAPLNGTPVHGSVSVSGLGSSAVVAGGDPSTYSVPLPPGIDGGWLCAMNLESIGKSFGGTGAVVVDSYAEADNPVGQATYRTMYANLVAHYNAGYNQTRVTLTPMSGNSPMSLELVFTTGASQPSLVTGRVLG